MGALSGKFINDQWPEGARLTKWRFFGRYLTPRARAATGKYITLAKSHNLDPSKWHWPHVNDRPFVTANIIGATTMEQLKINIDPSILPLMIQSLRPSKKFIWKTPWFVAKLASNHRIPHYFVALM